MILQLRLTLIVKKLIRLQKFLFLKLLLQLLSNHKLGIKRLKVTNATQDQILHLLMSNCPKNLPLLSVLEIYKETKNKTIPSLI